MSKVENLNTAPVSERMLVNKAEAAEAFGVSIPTVDNWLRRGCPYRERGGKGSVWVLHVLDVARWRYEGAPQDQEEDPEKLPSKERLDWYRGTRERTKHLLETGELVQVVDYERSLSAGFKSVAMMLESLPDMLERNCGITAEAVEATQVAVDKLRDDLYTRITGGGE